MGPPEGQRFHSGIFYAADRDQADKLWQTLRGTHRPKPLALIVTPVPLSSRSFCSYLAHI